MELFRVQGETAWTDAARRFCTLGRAASAAVTLLVLLPVGCALQGPDAGHPGPGGPVAWVEWAPLPQVRAVVAAGAACPALVVDGYAVPMTVRVAASHPPLRPPPKAADPAKPASFPVDVCSADLPEGAHRASVDGRAVPVPVALPQRIVVVGDSGCRLKDQELQDCNNPKAWPFAQVAAAAAALKPDLVIHVGDYHYRETPCPETRDCQGPWGYGWDAWNVDFFEPAAPLLAAAPWVLVRGNHEECSRAGQGWSRLLAAGPFRVERSCDDPTRDDVGDFSAPYAVPLGSGLQLVVFDSAHAGNAPLRPDRPKDASILAHYIAEMKQVAALSDRPGMRTWFTSHHPVLAYAPREGQPQRPYPGNAPLQAAMRSAIGPAYFPAGVQAALHGHVHNFQALDFSTGQPATLVAGNGGDNLDDRLPSPFPKDWPPAPGVQVDRITTANSFGFLLMERGEAPREDWTIHAYRADGSVLASCRLTAGRSLRCD